MAVVNNVAKQRIQRGGLALGLGLRQFRTVDVGIAAATRTSFHFARKRGGWFRELADRSVLP